MPTIQVNGTELYYELHGCRAESRHGPEDAEVLVLANGVLMSTASWALQTPVLSRHYRLLLHDCRGMWRSAHPAGPYTMELHADDLAGLMDALGIEKAHIGGISYGAELGMVFALKYPERTRSLILSSAVSHSDPVLEGLIGSWVAAAKMKDPALLYQVSYPLNFSDAYIAANRAAIEAAAERYQLLDMDAVLELLLCFNRLNITADLHKIDVPALVMVGEQDILKPRKYSEIIAREISGAELVIVPASGHALCLEQPGIFNALVLGFLARQN
jgi:3-oxoadipate enol-lactonase